MYTFPTRFMVGMMYAFLNRPVYTRGIKLGKWKMYIHNIFTIYSWYTLGIYLKYIKYIRYTRYKYIRYIKNIILWKNSRKIVTLFGKQS